MKTKITKKSRSLLMGLLIGDGSISNNNIFKLSHSEKQLEYLKWKLSLLEENGIKTNGIKSYISTTGYNTGKLVYYSQLKTIPFIKLLRRIVYKPKKTLSRKYLNRLTEQEIAIWYCDDGCINIRKTKNKIHGFYIRISTCVNMEQLQIIIDYFKEVWDIQFYKISEGRGTYSLCCGTTEGKKFINLVKPYIIPSMAYKINWQCINTTINGSKNETKGPDTGEDIV